MGLFRKSSRRHKRRQHQQRVWNQLSGNDTIDDDDHTDPDINISTESHRIPKRTRRRNQQQQQHQQQQQQQQQQRQKQKQRQRSSFRNTKHNKSSPNVILVKFIVYAIVIFGIKYVKKHNPEKFSSSSVSKWRSSNTNNNELKTSNLDTTDDMMETKSNLKMDEVNPLEKVELEEIDPSAVEI